MELPHNNPIRKLKHKTLIILDWDDTLFPTSWITKHGINLLIPVIREKYMVFFSQLDMLLHSLLSKLLKCGTVVIVTNAMIKWVVISSYILPNTQRLIKENIKIVSARDDHSDKHPGQMGIWKKKTFEQLVLEHFLDHYQVQNIISVGDAEYEFRALINLYNKHGPESGTKRLLKSVRLMANPSFELLIDQLKVLDESVPILCKAHRHMDLVFKDGKNAEQS